MLSTDLVREYPAEVQKKISTLRHRILGAATQDSQWYVAVEALEFAIVAHHGVYRSGGKIPYIVHPVDVSMFCLALSRLLTFPMETVSAALLHDVLEDCPGVRARDLSEKFGPTITEAVVRLSKVVDGKKKELSFVFEDIAQCPIASVCKASDRINNQDTMQGVFSSAKQRRQVAETQEYVLPMLKAARRQFPAQEPVYQVAKSVLNSQIAFVLSATKDVVASSPA
jgi:(p)ppGpp synthase/HD superfamily hydrolase